MITYIFNFPMRQRCGADAVNAVIFLCAVSSHGNDSTCTIEINLKKTKECCETRKSLNFL